MSQLRCNHLKQPIFQPLMKCKISCSLWLILMYVKHCLLGMEGKHGFYPNSFHIWPATALTTPLPGRACVLRHLHGQLCCASNCTPLASSGMQLCQVSVLIIASSISSSQRHINALKSPLTLASLHVRRPQRAFIHPFSLFMY